MLSPLMSRLSSPASHSILLPLFSYFLVSPPAKVLFITSHLLQHLPWQSPQQCTLSLTLLTLFLSDIDSLALHESQM